MNLIKNFSRQFIYPLITAVGAEHLLSAMCKSKKLILVYHGVVEQPNHDVAMGPISVKQLDEHFAYFKKHFDVVSLSEMFEMYRNNVEPKRKTIAITFDDGYENNYTHAYSLLKKYSFPATMYVITSCIENENMITWYDYIDFVKQDLQLEKIDVSAFNREPVISVDELKEFIKTLNISKREKLYIEIAKQVNIENYIPKFPKEFWKLMNKKQLKELADSGLVEIAPHSHTHPNLGQIELAEAKIEIEKSKKILEETIQQQVKSFGFPDGNYTDDVKRICLEAGYKNLLAADYRCASDLNDKSILPRLCVSSTTTTDANMILIHQHFAEFSF